MTSSAAVIIAAIVAAIVIVALVARSRRANDGVDSFRRQIDALSPEARRPVVDQVQNAADRQTRDDDDDGDPEDGVRGA
ncbi:MAG: hypothetical protein ABIP17_12365 [Ilumatobacteraceae bacterium]